MTHTLLLTNDDGYGSPGLRALEEALAPLGEIWVVAPEREQSAMSHALTLHKPLRLNSLSARQHAVSGTPTDCVFLAVNHLLRDRPPALVVSGINRGANLGDDVSYSGTVSAALEAALMGLPSIAISHVGYHDRDYGPAAAFAARLAAAVLASPLPPRTYLNVNVPDLPGERIRGVKATILGKRSYGNQVIEATDPRGKRYYWIGGSDVSHADVPGSDCNAVDAGYVSVTPLTTDPTLRGIIPVIESWELDPK
ncbi:5'/3'-nucleotidase SurE [Myxococcota bacterium]|nr:5'/3'-nucleotidase SurE [Myxococcota bacterium]